MSSRRHPRSCPSAESSELLRRDSRLGPAILCLLGKGRHTTAIVAAAAAVGADANIRLLIVVIAPATTLPLPQLRALTAPPGSIVDVRCPCPAAIPRSSAIGPIVHQRKAAIHHWRRCRADRLCRCRCCPNHCPSHPILRLIVVSSLLSALGSMLLSSSPSRPRKPTGRSSRGQ